MTDITPEKPVDILTLTEGQAELVREAATRLASAKQAVEEEQKRLSQLLAMVRPTGANGFDFDRMTFISVPTQGPPEETPEE